MVIIICIFLHMIFGKVGDRWRSLSLAMGNNHRHPQQDIIIAYGSHTPALSVQDATYNLQDRPWWSFRLMGWQLTNKLFASSKPENVFVHYWCFFVVLMMFYDVKWLFAKLFMDFMVLMMFACFKRFTDVTFSHQIPVHGRLTIWFGDLFHMAEHLEPSLFSCRKLYHTL